MVWYFLRCVDGFSQTDNRFKSVEAAQEYADYLDGDQPNPISCSPHTVEVSSFSKRHKQGEPWTPVSRGSEKQVVTVGAGTA